MNTHKKKHSVKTCYGIRALTFSLKCPVELCWAASRFHHSRRHLWSPLAFSTRVVGSLFVLIRVKSSSKSFFPIPCGVVISIFDVSRVGFWLMHVWVWSNFLLLPRLRCGVSSRHLSWVHSDRLCFLIFVGYWFYLIIGQIVGPLDLNLLGHWVGLLV